MKRKLTKIDFTGDYDLSFAKGIPNGLTNYTHYTLKNGGVLLTSNKNFKGISPIFIPYHRIDFIY